MRTVAIIQARMGSRRLPGKVVEDLGGRPLLAHVIERARRAKTLDEVVVATVADEHNNDIARVAAACQVVAIRGSEDDVLDRYRQAAKATSADVVVRITADCPLLDPVVVDDIITLFHASQCDYASNVHPPTYPDGVHAEVFSRDTLERAWREAKLRSEREHVTPYIVRHPEIFHQVNLTNTMDLSSLRWVVDEPRDLAFVRAVEAALGPGHYGLHEVLSLLAERPEIAALNAGITRNEGYAKSLREDGLFQPREPRPSR